MFLSLLSWITALPPLGNLENSGNLSLVREIRKIQGLCFACAVLPQLQSSQNKYNPSKVDMHKMH